MSKLNAKWINKDAQSLENDGNNLRVKVDAFRRAGAQRGRPEYQDGRNQPTTSWQVQYRL